MKKQLKLLGTRCLRLFLLSAILFSTYAVSYAQVSVKGKVTNVNGEALEGVNITIQNSQVGTITNNKGEYNISVPGLNSLLDFSYVGYNTVAIAINGRTVVDVTMVQSTQTLDDVVVVGYGTQRRVSITGAVSTLSDKELLKSPTIGVTNVLGSRVAGVTMLQSTGQPGYDAASLLIRGEGATYIVDGVQRSINEIDPNEIESVSVLKDATSASVYGLNATSVVIVTTKKGQTGKTNITYNGSYGISQNANQLKWLDGPGYAYWYNQARELDGDATVFTSEQVQKMRDGVDGWGNTNWYDKVFGVGSNSHHNVNASGGNDRVRFFTSVGAFQQKGNVDKFLYDRYNFRTNVDAKISKNLLLTINFAGREEKRDNPRYPADPNNWHNIPQQAVRALPYFSEKWTVEGKEYYVSTPTASSPVSPLAAINESGYARYKNTFVQSNFTLEYKFPWIEGLSAKFMGAYDRFMQFNKVLAIPFKTMLATLPNTTTENISYRLFTDNSGNTALTESAHSSTNVVTQSSLHFNRAFGEHRVNFLGLAETRNEFGNGLGATGYGLDFISLAELNMITNQTGNGTEKIPSISGSSSQSRLIGYVGRLNYEYSNRYLAELSMRRDGSYLFSGMNGARWINLPAFSLGWRINNESWFHATWVNNLKLRGGIGKTATSGVSPFQYLNLMVIAPNQFVLGQASQSILYTSTLGNPNLTWAKAITYNMGLDFNAWGGLLGLEFDVFYKYQYDLLGTISGAYPPSMGGYYFNTANVNKIDYRGFDMTLSHNNHIGEFNYGVKFIASYAKRRWLYYAGDSENTPDYRKLTGKEVGSQLGFISEGLFQSQEDINNSPTIPGAPVLPGYIKYKDRNGDGKITYAQDMGYVGKSAYPKYQTSLNLFGNWKGFDVDILLQAGLGRTVALTGVYTAEGAAGVMDNTAFTKPFYHGGNSPEFLLENSWTPENTNAEFPRLSLVTVSSNNAYSSTFWYRPGDYVRLKSFQIGYSVPGALLKRVGVERIRFFAQGSNLFTISELTKYNIDPEQPGVNNGYYPQQKTVSFGLNLSI